MRKQAIEKWLSTVLDKPWDSLEVASSDASFRGYWRLGANGESYIVMDAPPEKEPIKDFVQIGQTLAELGVHVPVMHALNPQEGFILMEDLGVESYLDKLNADSVASLYSDAINALIQMQSRWPESHALPAYDEAMLRREIQLFFDWLIGTHLAMTLSDAESAELNSCVDYLVGELLEQPVAFVHRDYHSRNLMVSTGQNPGVIDFQDAVIGPVTYDLVSMLRDCYIEWDEATIENFARQYFAAANGVIWQGEVEWDAFKRWFDWMGVQRHLKASGIFARLYHRDGKSGYLADIPLTLSYIVKVGKRYPELTRLANYIAEKMLPRFK